MSDQKTMMPAFTRRSLLGGLGASALLAGVPQSAIAQALLKKAPAFPGLTKIINDYVAEKKVAGMLAAIGFGQDDPQVISAGSLSLGGTKPMGMDTLFRMYSQTKPVTGMATMMLIEDGKLTLDQPVSDILPEFKEMQLLLEPEGPLDQTEPAKEQITIRQLLTHTTGLGYTIISKGPILKAYSDNGITPGRVSLGKRLRESRRYPQVVGRQH